MVLYNGNSRTCLSFSRMYVCVSRSAQRSQSHSSLRVYTDSLTPPVVCRATRDRTLRWASYRCHVHCKFVVVLVGPGQCARAPASTCGCSSLSRTHCASRVFTFSGSADAPSAAAAAPLAHAGAGTRDRRVESAESRARRGAAGRRARGAAFTIFSRVTRLHRRAFTLQRSGGRRSIHAFHA